MNAKNLAFPGISELRTVDKEIDCAVFGIVQNRIFTGFLKFWNVVKRRGLDTVSNTQLTKILDVFKAFGC
ncbi:hypothetical protein [Anaeromicropila populeti]|uniref:hypothetical protein n=1 Tax=Anaeromicropila populeti TaxID=37658 RepID=UPI0015A5270D|nr:hypothetical protein [Anaeromicropila populeti]